MTTTPAADAPISGAAVTFLRYVRSEVTRV